MDAPGDVCKGDLQVELPGYYSCWRPYVRIGRKPSFTKTVVEIPPVVTAPHRGELKWHQDVFIPNNDVWAIDLVKVYSNFPPGTILFRGQRVLHLPLSRLEFRLAVGKFCGCGPEGN